MSIYDTPQLADQCIECNLSLKAHTTVQLRSCNELYKLKQKLNQDDLQKQTERNNLTKKLRKKT